MSHKGKDTTFTSKEALVQELASRIASILNEAILQKGKAFMALSGGSTPKPLFEILSTMEVQWQKVMITLVDERWVDESDEASNAALVRNHLLINKASTAQFMGLKNSAKSAVEGQNECEQRFTKMNEDFDVVLLGMGEDGHTASFFPHAKALENALETEKSCVALTPLEAPYERMSLSLSRLKRAEHIFLHIEGEKKRAVFENALEEAEVKTLPIRAFIHKDIPPYLEVYYAK